MLYSLLYKRKFLGIPKNSIITFDDSTSDNAPVNQSWPQKTTLDSPTSYLSTFNDTIPDASTCVWRWWNVFIHLLEPFCFCGPRVV